MSALLYRLDNWLGNTEKNIRDSVHNSVQTGINNFQNSKSVKNTHKNILNMGRTVKNSLKRSKQLVPVDNNGQLVTNFNHSKKTPIHDYNIHRFVRLYCDNRKNELPESLRNLPIGEWDVHRVTEMDGLFKDQITFNEPLNKWNVGAVRNMREMFYGATTFNQPLNLWSRYLRDRYVDLQQMFVGANAFNQDLSSWKLYHSVNIGNRTHMYIDSDGELRMDGYNRGVQITFMFNQEFNQAFLPKLVSNDGTVLRNWYGMVLQPTPALLQEIIDEPENLQRQQRQIQERQRPVQRLATQTEQPITLEIHEEYRKNQNKYTELHDALLGLNDEHKYTDDISVVINKLKEHLKTKEDQVTFDEILNRLQNFNPGKDYQYTTVFKFLVNQNSEFIEYYLKLLISDCAIAHGVNEHGKQLYSCPQGTRERVLTTFFNTIIQYCSDENNNTQCTPELRKLWSIFEKEAKKNIDINEVLKEWFQMYMDVEPPSEIANQSTDDRLAHLTNFLRQKKPSITQEELDKTLKDVKTILDIDYATSSQPVKKGGRTRKKTAKKRRKH